MCLLFLCARGETPSRDFRQSASGLVPEAVRHSCVSYGLVLG